MDFYFFIFLFFSKLKKVNYLYLYGNLYTVPSKSIGSAVSIIFLLYTEEKFEIKRCTWDDILISAFILSRFV